MGWRRTATRGPAVLALLGVLAATGPARAGEPGAAVVGEPAPDVRVYDGERDDGVQLADVLRGRPVLLVFWATWCRWCRQELPVVERVRRLHGDDGLAVVAVNVEPGDRVRVAARARSILADLRVGASSLVDPSGDALRAYRVRGLPTTFLIDRAGIVRAAEVGFRDWTSGAARRQLRELLDR